MSFKRILYQQENLNIVIEAFQNIFPGENISQDSDFFDLGGDSFKAVELCLLLEQSLLDEVHPSFLFETSSPKAIAEYLDQRLHDRR